MDPHGRAAQRGATEQVVEHILDDLGLSGGPGEAVLVDGGPVGGSSVFGSREEFGHFIGRFSLEMGCMPYSVEAVGHLTVREFCEHYVQESYPEPPQAALRDDQYPIGEPAAERAVFAKQPFPICFVLGCGRSGTTLFRAMLNRHDQLWAPGELHLAQFDTMADRATGAGPFLRHALVPEAASRFGETPDQFSDRLAGWERDAEPVPEVYRQLYEADPTSVIIDKTPTYSARIEHLEWIGHHFENATFVHIIRSPHDVIRSLVRIQLYKDAQKAFEPGTNPYHVAETLWYRHNANIAGFLERLSASRSVMVRFEELVADPEPSLAAVCDLVGVGYAPVMADPYAGDAQVALGAGDPRVNQATAVERRAPTEPFYPLAAKSQELARAYGY